MEICGYKWTFIGTINICKILYTVHCLIVHPFGCTFNLLLDFVLKTNQMKFNTSRGIFTQAIFPWEEDTEFYKPPLLLPPPTLPNYLCCNLFYTAFQCIIHHLIPFVLCCLIWCLFYAPPFCYLVVFFAYIYWLGYFLSCHVISHYCVLWLVSKVLVVCFTL